MIIRYYGHAFFGLSLENGMEIVIDPYGDFYDFPKRSVHADVCLISHHHYDHDGVSSLAPGAQLLDQPGVHRLANGVNVHAIPTWHDDVQGEKRGGNLVHVVEAEGLRIGHAGDLGHMPSAKQLAQIAKLDVLMIPVGGYYTIDAATALAVCRTLQPQFVIPMHYRTAFDTEMPIAPIEAFLSLAEATDEQHPLLRITKADVSQRPSVVTMAVQP